MDVVKMLIVEDDMIIGADLSLTLSQEGYEVMGIVSRGELVAEYLKADLPDLILMATTLKALEKRLQDPGFLRVHRSYMINLNKLERCKFPSASLTGKSCTGV